MKIKDTSQKKSSFYTATPVAYDGSTMVFKYEDGEIISLAIKKAEETKVGQTLKSGKVVIKVTSIPSIPSTVGGDGGGMDDYPPLPSLASIITPTVYTPCQGHTYYVARDSAFLLPIAQLRIAIFPRETVTPEFGAAMDVLVKMVGDVLQGELYDAELAGVEGSVSVGVDNELYVSVGGFDDKVPEVGCLVLKGIWRAVEIGGEAFDRCKELVARTYKNSGNFVGSRASDARLSALLPHKLGAEAKASALEGIDAERFREVRPGA